ARPTAAPPARSAAIVRDFNRAWEAKDIDALIGLLDPAARATADGGGFVTTFLHPIEGGEQIAHAWAELARRKPAEMTVVETTVNGQPGLEARRDGATVTVFAFEVTDDRITNIWAVLNPEKLTRWTATAD
ncbi:MAG: RNA polymerase subunit sigma-24, partial [Spirillospora sp.]